MTKRHFKRLLLLTFNLWWTTYAQSDSVPGNSCQPYIDHKKISIHYLYEKNDELPEKNKLRGKLKEQKKLMDGNREGHLISLITNERLTLIAIDSCSPHCKTSQNLAPIHH